MLLLRLVDLVDDLAQHIVLPAQVLDLLFQLMPAGFYPEFVLALTHGAAQFVRPDLPRKPSVLRVVARQVMLDPV
jgi:hypothetical protein